MEIDATKYRKLLLWIFENIEKIEAELLAHQTVFALLKMSGEFGDLDTLIQKARENRPPAFAAKYQDIRSTISAILERADADQALQEFFLKWKPSEKVN